MYQKVQEPTSYKVDYTTLPFRTTTAEMVVGVDDNNHPIYRQTIDITSPSVASGGRNFNVGATTLVDWDIRHINSGSGFISKGPSYIDNPSNPAATFSVTVGKDSAYFSGVSASFQGQTFKLTLYYLK